MAKKQLLYKEPEVDLRLKYPKWMELSTIASLIFLTGMFYMFQKCESGVKLSKTVDTEFLAEIIPPTQQIKKPPPP